ncbi:Rabankyrin-5 [Lamellibrachia satsuma]|nr:Rabankyrin-5 [Lamellibrachia satsuma]
MFLLEHKADCNIRTKDNQTCLELAIKRHLVAVVDQLCKQGAAVNETDDNGDCPLWQALDTGQEDIASLLVQHGCDTNVFCSGPCGCEQTLLHRAIDENNETVACFLIRSLCDTDGTRRPGPNGEGEDEARDGQTALHMAATWGLDKVVQCLVEHNVNVNAQDAEGKTALHIAIENQHHMIISLLMSHPSINLSLQDKQGLTPFAVAMATKNNKAAEEILAREPLAAEQFDPRGRNFLHIAIQKSDIESVLFLLSVHANVNSCIQDASKLSPLHIAIKVGAEIIVRNLLLAGAQVNDLTTHKQTGLHLAASCDHAVIGSVLLQNGVDCNALDDNMCNALHIATQLGHLNTVKVLLTESDICAEAVNLRGQNPLHLLGQYSRENGAAIFELFLECMPNYPIDQPDINGNTLLMLAYFNGNANLCRAVVRAGAMMGLHNKDGVSIFNAPVATKQLLLKLLDMLSREPPWCEGDNCLECGVKFGIKTRKHHCRHCGRLLCAKCSDRQMPIIKYNITKPVRVCQTCFDVLTLGLSS